MTLKSEKITITESSGNVFADLECQNPEELKVKARLAAFIGSVVEHRNITHAQAARVLGITQSQVSDLKRGHLKHFSVGRLLKLLNILGWDVEIRIIKNPNTRREACVTVVSE